MDVEVQVVPTDSALGVLLPFKQSKRRGHRCKKRADDKCERGNAGQKCMNNSDVW